MSKVALHSREHDLPAEVFDFQTCGDGLAKELVVCFDFFIWCFYQYFSMLITEAHKGLGSAGHFADRQATFVQRLPHIQEDDGVHYVAEYLSPDGVGRPFGQRQKAEIFLARLDDTLDIRPSEVFRKQIYGLELLVGKQDKVAEAHGHPILFLVLQGGIFLGVVKHVVAFPLKGVMLVHIHVGKDFLSEKLDFLPLAEVDVSSADETVLSFVETGLELVIEGLERKALPRRHPADERLFRTVVESVYDLLGDVTRIQNKRVDSDVKTHSHVIHDRHYSVDVKNIAGDDVIPHWKAGLLIQNKDKARLDGGGVNTMATECIEGIVVNVVRERCGVHIAALPEVRIGLPHPFHKGLEEGKAHAVLTHHGEVRGIATERCRGDVSKDIGGKGLLDEVVTTYAASIAENAVQNMAQDTFTLDLIRESRLQDFCYPGLREKAKQEMSIAKNGMYLRIRENVNAPAGQTLIGAGNLIKTVGNGIVGHKPSLRRKEYPGFAVRRKPDNFSEAFAHNLSGMELATIPYVLRLLDCGAAAENISVSVPHQFLNSNKRHGRMSYIVVLSSTTNLRNISDNSKHFKSNFIKNQSFSNCSPAA